jgi:hypothetical protein
MSFSVRRLSENRGRGLTGVHLREARLDPACPSLGALDQFSWPRRFGLLQAHILALEFVHGQDAGGRDGQVEGAGAPEGGTSIFVQLTVVAPAFGANHEPAGLGEELEELAGGLAVHVRGGQDLIEMLSQVPGVLLGPGKQGDRQHQGPEFFRDASLAE